MRDVYFSRDALLLAVIRAIGEVRGDRVTTVPALLATAGALTDMYAAYEGGLDVTQFVREAYEAAAEAIT